MTDPHASAIFPGVRGHHAAQTALARALERGQLHHALVLVGPRGVGKATFARGLAAAMLCPQLPGRGCGQCVTCQRVAHGQHTDVDWLTPDTKAGTISVDSARACHVRQSHGPYESDRYIVIIDPADGLGEGAGNALLKTIEEPRPGIHFLLLTTNLQGILPTILSRALPIRIGRLDDADVTQILRERAPELPDDRQHMAVLLAEGSAGIACELATDPSLERCLVLLDRALQAVDRGPPAIFSGDQSPLWSAWTTASEPLPTRDDEPPPPEVIAVTTTSKRSKAASKAKTTKAKPESEASDGKPARSKDAPALQRAAVRRMIELWVLHVREQMRGRPGLQNLTTTAKPRAPSQYVAMIAALQTLETRIERNTNPRLALEQALLELSRV